jgi:DNA-binding CsgD family transcriptional regulator
MSPRAKKHSVKLPALQDRKGAGNARPLLDMNIQLIEVNDRMDLRISCNKSQFIGFFACLSEKYFFQGINIRGLEDKVCNDIIPVPDERKVTPDMIRRVNALSGRQREIFERLLKGLSNTQIADEMKLAVNTIKNHNQDIFLKLGVPNRYVAIALYHWLIVKSGNLSHEK